ncbi:hypothetical protein BXZ70DRAFT_908224 [Cristinia sonorae]|uniref:Uncharacterized protein n=1 Tax=Cristinia sonorae TaxID=1940300 RepID=A0A8K0XNI5_9AGAR|nr:hypothetical protein BXZ70DRAFT_908224 [Cristinia sonorae]
MSRSSGDSTSSPSHFSGIKLPVLPESPPSGIFDFALPHISPDGEQEVFRLPQVLESAEQMQSSNKDKTSMAISPPASPVVEFSLPDISPAPAFCEKFHSHSSQGSTLTHSFSAHVSINHSPPLIPMFGLPELPDMNSSSGIPAFSLPTLPDIGTSPLIPTFHLPNLDDITSSPTPAFRLPEFPDTAINASPIEAFALPPLPGVDGVAVAGTSQISTPPSPFRLPEFPDPNISDSSVAVFALPLVPQEDNAITMQQPADQECAEVLGSDIIDLMDEDTAMPPTVTVDSIKKKIEEYSAESLLVRRHRTLLYRILESKNRADIANELYNCVVAEGLHRKEYITMLSRIENNLDEMGDLKL